MELGDQNCIPAGSHSPANLFLPLQEKPGFSRAAPPQAGKGAGKKEELPNPLMETFANCPIRPSQPWENGFLAVAKCLLKIALDFFTY